MDFEIWAYHFSLFNMWREMKFWTKNIVKSNANIKFYAFSYNFMSAMHTYKIKQGVGEI